MLARDVRLAILLSGGGTTAEKVIKETHDGGVLTRVDPVLVIASRDDAGGIKKAIATGVDPKNVLVIKRRDFTSAEEFGQAIVRACLERQVNLVAQLGWLPLTPAEVIEWYRGRIINQHPGPLDPATRHDFGGQGMYGRAVHAAVLDYVRATAMPMWHDNSGTDLYREHFRTEMTVHEVTAELDAGQILQVAEVPIRPDHDVVSLQQEALAIEHRLVVDVIKRISEGRAPSFKRQKPLVPYNWIPQLEASKAVGMRMFPKG